MVRSGYGILIPSSDPKQTIIKFNHSKKEFDSSDFLTSSTNNHLSLDEVEKVNEDIRDLGRSYFATLTCLKICFVFGVFLVVAAVVVGFFVLDGNQTAQNGSNALVALVVVLVIVIYVILRSKRQTAIQRAQIIVKPYNDKLKPHGVDFVIPQYFPVYYQIRHNVVNQITAQQQFPMMMQQMPNPMNNSMQPMMHMNAVNNGYQNRMPQVEVIE